MQHQMLHGAVGTGLYCVLVLSLRWYFEIIFGQEVEGYFSNGTPRWRCALGLVTQACVLPVLFIWSWSEHAFDLRLWSKHYVKGTRSVSDWMFVFVFAAFLSLDWILVEVRTLMAAHHVACLVGHFIATGMLTQAFSYYFAGVCALELGSASCNLFCMYSSSRVWAASYFICVSVCHVFTLMSMRNWVALMPSRISKAIGLSITVGLVLLRQREAFASCRSFVFV